VPGLAGARAGGKGPPREPSPPRARCATPPHPDPTVPHKSASTRIDKTLAYIGDTPLFDASLRPAVQAFADGYIGRAQWGGAKYIIHGQKAFGSYKRFSDEMTMTDVSSPGTTDERAMRRAIFVLWSAMGDPQAAALAKSLLVGAVQAEFVRTMWKALCVADERNGRERGPAAVYGQLRDDPVAFLLKTKVQVDGTTQFDPNGGKNLIDFVFRFEPMKDKYLFDTAAHHNGGVGMFMIPGVTSVPAGQWDTVAGRGAKVNEGSFRTIRGTHYDGTLMVTTQLTGCTFCVQDVGGTLCSAHLKPSSTLDGTALAQQLAGLAPPVTGGAFSSPPVGVAGTFHVFGRGFGTLPNNAGGYDARIAGAGNYATVIGFRRRGTWQLYVQEVYNGSILGARKIL
jgi:hypothetical protein